MDEAYEASSRFYNHEMRKPRKQCWPRLESRRETQHAIQYNPNNHMQFEVGYTWATVHWTIQWGSATTESRPLMKKSGTTVLPLAVYLCLPWTLNWYLPLPLAHPLPTIEAFSGNPDAAFDVERKTKRYGNQPGPQASRRADTPSQQHYKPPNPQNKLPRSFQQSKKEIVNIKMFAFWPLQARTIHILLLP